MTVARSEGARAAGLAGLRVVAFESRRAAEIAELIRRHGGEPLVAPAVREVALGENTAALDLLRQLDAGTIDVLILMTGVGVRTLIDAVAGTWPRERIVAALGRTRLVARGPKPVAALRALGLTAALTVPEPNTWREIVAALDAHLPVAGTHVAVQEYGARNDDLIAALQARGAAVLSVPIYRWALPADLAPLRAAIAALCAGEVDVALFTSGVQVEHLFQVAEQSGLAERVRGGFARTVVAAIGPTCAQALRGRGLVPDIEPVHPKMGHLVAEAARRGPEALAAKRALGGVTR